MAGSPATGMTLISLLPWNKDSVQQAGKALSPKPLNCGGHNVRPATPQRCPLPACTPTGETKSRLSVELNMAYQEHDWLLMGLNTYFQLDHSAFRSALCRPGAQTRSAAVTSLETGDAGFSLSGKARPTTAVEVRPPEPGAQP